MPRLHAPSSSGTSGSGLPSNVRIVTANATAAGDDLMLVDATAGAVTITLPSTGAVSVKKIDSSGNDVTVDPAGAGTIEGDANAVITDQYAGAVFQSTAADTWVIFAPMTTNAGPAGAAGADGAGQYLAIVEYNPGVLADYSVTSNATLGDVDATNLAVTFTGPDSGFVVVCMSADVSISGGVQACWGLRSGSSDVAGSLQVATHQSSPARQTYRKRFVVTPGLSYTWKWAATNSTAGQTQHIYAGGATVGPASMYVESSNV